MIYGFLVAPEGFRPELARRQSPMVRIEVVGKANLAHGGKHWLDLISTILKDVGPRMIVKGFFIGLLLLFP